MTEPSLEPDSKTVRMLRLEVNLHRMQSFACSCINRWRVPWAHAVIFFYNCACQRRRTSPHRCSLISDTHFILRHDIATCYPMNQAKTGWFRALYNCLLFHLVPTLQVVKYTIVKHTMMRKPFKNVFFVWFKTVNFKQDSFLPILHSITTFFGISGH